MYKTLGIIGGMGPLATVKLFEKIVLNTKANCDQEHIHILIDNNINIPDRTSFILDNKNEDPRPELIASAKRLQNMGAEFLAMPCNTAHYFYEDIISEINIPLLNMIELTLQHIKENNLKIKKVGLLSTEGTIKAKIYDNIFEPYDIELIKPSKENQRYITDLIYNIKEDKLETDLDGFYNTIDQMKEKGAMVFITGCTELSVALDLYNLKGEFIDPMEILTREIIKLSGRETK